jgi:VanZ family protein
MPTALTAQREKLQMKQGYANLVSTWLPVLIGLCVIAFESTNTMSAERTSRYLRPFFTWLCGPITEAHWGAFHHVLRKSGHFIGYGTLGLIWLRAWLRALCNHTGWTQTEWRVRCAALGVGFTFLTACGDELHQTFLPSRTGQFSDVLLDTCGALVFTLLVAARWRRSA